MTPTQRAAAERLAEFESLPRKLLDIACRVRVNECLFHDDEFVDDASHTLKEALALLRELAAEPMQEPAIWIQSNHLQHAKNGPYLARTGPTKLMSDFIPLYAAPQQRKPLSDAFVSQVVRSVQPNLSATCKAWAEQFDECKYWLDAAHEAEQLALPMEDKT